MAETDESAGRGAGAAGSTGGENVRPRAEDESGAAGDEAAELRAEEESAKAMEAEVPHPQGYEDPGQEPPSESGQE